MHHPIDAGLIEFANTESTDEDGLISVTVHIKHDLSEEESLELRAALERQLLHRVEIWAHS